MAVSAVFGVHEGLSGSTRISALSRRITNRAAIQIGAWCCLVWEPHWRAGCLTSAPHPRARDLAIGFSDGAGPGPRTRVQGGNAHGRECVGHRVADEGVWRREFWGREYDQPGADRPTAGPRFDWARRGWRLYLGFILAGLGSNLVAMCFRGGMKALTGDMAGGRPVSEWWHQASFTYPVVGLLAGLISAAVWFRLRGDRSRSRRGETEE